MTQKLEVSIAIPIPADSVLIKKVEYEQLKEESLSGRYWTMSNLEERIGKKREWIKEHILYNRKFIRKLDSLIGGPVYYPQTRGETWSFQANRMAQFLDDNFSEIFKED